jgi:hypothetical protein
MRRIALVSATVLSLAGPTLAQAPSSGDAASAHARHPRQIASFSVGPDQSLVYPDDLPALPDEQVTFWPPAPGSNTYLMFAASSIRHVLAGTVVLQTSNLKSFSYAAKYTSPVMVPPIKFTTCNPTYDSEFDENYSAPGSVVQDPTRPPGHLIMIYEAENIAPEEFGSFNFTPPSALPGPRILARLGPPRSIVSLAARTGGRFSKWPFRRPAKRPLPPSGTLSRPRLSTPPTRASITSMSLTSM